MHIRVVVSSRPEERSQEKMDESGETYWQKNTLCAGVEVDVLGEEGGRAYEKICSRLHQPQT